MLQLVLLCIFETQLEELSSVLPFCSPLLLHFDPSVQLVDLESEVLLQFVPLGLHRWSEQAVLDGEQLGVDADGLHLKDRCGQMVLATMIILLLMCTEQFRDIRTCSKDLRPPSLPSRNMSAMMAALTSYTEDNENKYDDKTHLQHAINVLMCLYKVTHKQTNKSSQIVEWNAFMSQQYKVHLICHEK